MKRDITKFVGCDLGDKKSHLCWLDRDARVLKRETIATTRKGFTQAFGKLSGESLRVIIETGTHARWVKELLVELGIEVVVANARRIHLISHSMDKGDAVDAERLAMLGHANVKLLSPVTLRSSAAQGRLLIVKVRRHLVESRTGFINLVRGIAKAAGYRVRKCDSAAFAKRARSELPEELQKELQAVLVTLEELSAKIKVQDALIEAVANKSIACQQMQQIQGVGALTALTFEHTLEKAERFAKSRDVGAYLGLVPKRHQSGGADPQLRITKQGDPYLRALLVNCAQYILGPFGCDSDLRRHGERIAKGSSKSAKKRAVIAVARKLAVLMHRLWKTGEHYEALGYKQNALMAA